MPLPPETILKDQYRIESLLGQGGMGAVYLAYDLNLHRHCAVKENMARRHPDQDFVEESTRQFEREAVILAGLKHPNLPRVTNYFKLGDEQYLVMDYVEGEDLAIYLKKHGRLSEPAALKWIGQVCSALTYLHTHPRAPIIHRDVKPANIKITPEGDAVLVDFGLSKMNQVGSAGGNTTLMGAKGFTMGFSSPEQEGLLPTDARSDQYAVAATLYALLSGEAPPDAVERKRGYAQLNSVRDIVPTISEEVADTLLRALELEAAERFETVAAFWEALQGRGVPSPAPIPTDSTTTFEVPLPALPPAILVAAQGKFSLGKERNLIGRLNRSTGETPDIDLTEEPNGDTVSRKHAWLNYVDGEWYLQPHTDHKNVIRVNGKQIASKEETRALRPGDEIQIGAVKLKFEL